MDKRRKPWLGSYGTLPIPQNARRDPVKGNTVDKLLLFCMI
jgi:hypothetical protein